MKMKCKVLVLVMIAAMCMPCIAAVGVGISYNFDDGTVPAAIVAGNNENLSVSVTGGIYGKNSNDYCYTMTRTGEGHTNPYGKISKGVTAENNQYIHLRAALAIDDFSLTTIGIGGKLVYKNEAGEKLSGFLAKGTPIGINNGVLSCFGIDVSGVILKEKQFYTIDVLVNVGEAVGSTAKVFVNGIAVAETLSQTTKIGDSAIYQLLGFEDLRLNIATTKAASFKCYFDDILLEITDNEENADIAGGIRPSGTINLGADGYISRADVNGMNASDIRSNFAVPENAALELINKLGRSLNNLTKTNYLRLSNANGSCYIYRIEDAQEQTNEYTTLYSNNMNSAISGTTISAGIGGRAQTDYSCSPTTASVNIYPSGTLNGKKLILEASFYATDYSGQRAVEAVSGTGIFARYVTFTADGNIATGAPQTNMLQYSLNTWYDIAAVVNEDLTYDFYINGEKQDTSGLCFSNIASDTKIFNALTRMKISFGSLTGFYMDDFACTVAENYPYKSDKLTSYLSTERFNIIDDVIYTDNPNMSTGEFLTNFDADDEIYIKDKTEDEVIGFEAVLIEKVNEGEISHNVSFNKVTHGRFLSDGSEIHNMSDITDNKVYFNAEVENKSDKDISAYLILAAYNSGGILTDITITCKSAAKGNAVSIYTSEIDTQGSDSVEAWLISDFIVRKPLSKVFKIK